MGLLRLFIWKWVLIFGLTALAKVILQNLKDNAR